MHVFLAYLLATVLIVFGFRVIDLHVTGWVEVVVTVLRVIVYWGLGAGLLYVVWRYVRRW